MTDTRVRLAEVDARLASQLADLGFSPEEIRRQLDPTIPDEVKDQEREQVLARKFATDLQDPSTGLLESIVANMAPQLEAAVEREIEQRKAVRRRVITMGAIAAAGVALGIWYFAIRDSRSTCQRVAGSQAELETLTGQPGRFSYDHDNEYACTRSFTTPDARNTLIELDYQNGGYRGSERASDYAEVRLLSIGGHSATLYIAGDAKELTTDELLANAKANVGTTRDPVGAALAAAPRTKHVVLVSMGRKELRVTLDRSITPAQAEAYVTSVLKRF